MVVSDVPSVFLHLVHIQPSGVMPFVQYLQPGIFIYDLLIYASAVKC